MKWSLVNYETSLFHNLVFFNNNFRFSIKWYSRAQQVIKHKYVKYTCSMETVQQNGPFTLFSSKFLSIYSILYGFYAHFFIRIIPCRLQFRISENLLVDLHRNGRSVSFGNNVPWNYRVPPVLYINLKWRAKFRISRLLIRDSDWWN